MKILIAGQARSGTTALYYALKQTLPPEYTGLFEPQRYEDGADQFVLAKVIIHKDARLDDFDSFEKRVLVVRDPRDNLISRLLYSTFHQEFISDDASLRFFMQLLERKQKNPQRVSVRELFKVLSDLSGKDILEMSMLHHQAALKFDTSDHKHLTYRYEDFVAGQYSELEDYLGVKLRFDGNVDASLIRVARTKGAGDWQNWFTPEDAEFFRPLYHEYMVRYGYDLDWITNSDPRILPEHSTEYVMRLVREKRAE